MKIVFVCDVFYPYFDGGGVIEVFEKAKNLVKLGHKVIVICNRNAISANKSDLFKLKDKEIVEGIEIHRTNRPYTYGAVLSSIPALFQMYKILKNLIENDEIDVCIPVQNRPCIPTYLAARNRKPCVPQWFHTTLKGRLLGFQGWKNYDKSIFRRIFAWLLESYVIRLPYEGFFTPSKSSKDDLLKYSKSDKIYIIPPGINWEYINNIETPKKKNQVIWVGRFEKQKNITHTIKAVIQARKRIKDLKLVIVSNKFIYK